jgi:signal transduction histidine kinase/ligand-binding sensor domain-containing protein/ActR/RegA family two-component response regulator
MKRSAASSFLILLAGAGLPFWAGGVRAEDEASGQPDYSQPWQVTSYLTEAGLGQQRVFDLAFTPDGTAWLAADDGLHRFDGFTWSLFGTNDGLPSSFTRAVSVDAQGRLWVGSDGGAGVWDPERRKYDAQGSATGLPNANVREIDQAPDGSLWFACDQWPDPTIQPGGLSCFNPRSGAWKTYHQTNGLPMDYILGYFCDSTGRQFALARKGWAQGRDGQWGPPVNPGAEAEDCVLQMAEARDGTLFAQGEHTLLTLARGRWENHPTSQTRLVGSTRSGEVVAVESNPERGLLWFSLWDGHQFVRTSALVPCPAHARLYHLREAPDGSLWCVGTGTVVRWAYHAGQWTLYPHLPTPAGADALGRVWFADDSNIVVRAGGHFQTLAPGKFRALNEAGQALIWDPSRTQLMVTAPQDPTRRTVVETGCASINTITQDAGGGFWILGQGPAGDGVVAHYAGGRSRILTAPEFHGRNLTAATPLPTGRLLVVANRPDNNLYDVARVTEDRVEWVPFAPATPPLMYANPIIGAGRHWLYGYSGLYEQSATPTGDWAPVTAFPDSGFLWALASERELFLTFSGGRSGHAGCALFCSNQWSRVYGEFAMPGFDHTRTTIYLPSRGGVFIRRQPGTLDFERLQIPSDVFVNTVVPDRAGALWLGCSDGTLRYQPGRAPPKTWVEVPAGGVPRGAPLPVMFRGQERFESAPNPDGFRYSWRIDHADWSPFEPWQQDYLRLPGLRSGRHSLAVRARDVDGNVDSTPTTVAFTVLAEPLQNQPWFLPLAAGMVLLLAWLAGWQIRARIAHTRQIAATNSVLRQEIAIRRQAESELERTRDELEQRVADRTDQLTRSNRQLRHEIAERHQAEEHKRHLLEQLSQSQKMEALGTMAGGIAHDFNNILAVIIPYGHILSEELPDRPDLQEHLREMLKAANRAKNLVQQILTFSRRQPRLQPQSCELSSIVKEAMILLRFVLPSTIQMNQDIHRTSRVLTDPTQIHQVVMNLCINAQHAMEGRQGLLEVGLNDLLVDAALCLRHPDLKPGRYVRLVVKDNGCGIAPEILPRIFDPFFTTKEVGKGTGLGLAVVHGIVQNHEGAILVDSEPGRGTEFQILFPVQTEAGRELNPAAAPPQPANGEHILLVDDEPAIVQGIKRLLERAGYRVTAHADPLAAFKDFTARPADIQLILTDLTMPGMNGLELAARAYQIRPELPLIIATGFAGDSITPKQRAEHPNIRRVVEKPLNPEEITRLVAEVLGKTKNSK